MTVENLNDPIQIHSEMSTCLTYNVSHENYLSCYIHTYFENTSHITTLTELLVCILLYIIFLYLCFMLPVTLSWLSYNI